MDLHHTKDLQPILRLCQPHKLRCRATLLPEVPPHFFRTCLNQRGNTGMYKHITYSATIHILHSCRTQTTLSGCANHNTNFASSINNTKQQPFRIRLMPFPDVPVIWVVVYPLNTAVAVHDSQLVLAVWGWIAWDLNPEPFGYEPNALPIAPAILLFDRWRLWFFV